MKRTSEIYRKNTEVILSVLKLIRSLVENEEMILNKSWNKNRYILRLANFCITSSYINQTFVRINFIAQAQCNQQNYVLSLCSLFTTRFMFMTSCLIIIRWGLWGFVSFVFTRKEIRTYFLRGSYFSTYLFLPQWIRSDQTTYFETKCSAIWIMQYL